MRASSRRRCSCARLRGLELPDETWQWLRRRYPRDMRALYELLDTLDEAALSAQRRLTIPFIREVLRSGAHPPR
ncbi:MAG: HdaA/DnaA family protein [Steroidobacteraceae bacterium]